MDPNLLLSAPALVYTRAQSLRDGVLVDLSEWASADSGFFGGFTVPVAVTAAVWADLQAIPRSLVGIQTVRDRAHDLLWMASQACRSRPGSSTTFRVLLRVAGQRSQQRTYRIAFSPGDHGEPVVTIVQPGED